MWSDIQSIRSTDNDVIKFVFKAKDAIVESVLYKYNMYEDRTVICCSTQSGCPVGCRFCGSGDYFVRNLTGEEIAAQPIHLLDWTGVDTSSIKKLQIMFMSMGEPLLNFKNLEIAIKILHEKYPNADLLISTTAPDVGWIYDDLIKLSVEIPKIGLQFSIHESLDENRNKLIPFKHKLNLKAIGVVGSSWAAATGRRPFFNYCAHENNTSIDDVNRLKGMFDPAMFECTISVICERNENVAAANKRQEDLAFNFMQKMLSAGYSCRLFNPSGQDDIGGGCGQLWYVQKWMRENPDKAKPSIGKGLEHIHAPR